MATVTSYATLVQNIQDILENDDSEFVDYIPTAISFAEDRLIKENDFEDLIGTSTGSVTAGNYLVTKPTDDHSVQNFYLTSGGSKFAIKFRQDDFIVDYWPNVTTQGTPKYYSNTAETQYRIAPTADATYTYEIKYSKIPTKLSTSNTTNYFVTNCPDLLFNACLVEMAKFMKAWNQVQVFEQQYQMIRESWNLRQAMNRRDSTATPMSPEGSSNTLKHTINTNS